MQGRTALLLAVLVLVAGCGGSTGTDSVTPSETALDASSVSPTPARSPGPSTGTSPPSPTTTSTPEMGPHADPQYDTKGWELGIWHNESIDVDNSDGLDQEERRLVLARIIARVELILDREIRDQEIPTLEFITREQLREQNTTVVERNAFRDQLWEAMFVVGEDRNWSAVRTELNNVVYDGYSTRGGAVFVVNDTESPRLDPGVIAHEIGHGVSAPWDVGRAAPGFDRTDERITFRSMIEGFPDWLEERYLERCGQQWDCIERPDVVAHSQAVNEGLYVQFSAPYVLGDQLMETQGPAAVWNRQPISTEQLIHPEKWETDELPVTVSVDDKSAADWERVEIGQFVNGTEDRVGEVMVYTMFWSNNLTNDSEDIQVTVGQENGLDYNATPSNGWGGDAFVVYSNGSAYGYVFKTVWDSESDASEFYDTYRQLLQAHGAQQINESTWVVETGPYADAFRIIKQGQTVIIINAPSVNYLDNVHETNGTTIVATVAA